MSPTFGWLCTLAILSLFIVIGDIFSRKIGNDLCMAVAVMSLFLSISTIGSPNIISPFVVLIFGVALTHLGLLGGGDSKLLAAYAIAIDPQNIPLTLFMITIVGGLVSVIYLVINRFIHKTTEGVPYGIAIAIGGLLGVLASI
ncbi:hypothetical protein F0237_23635 [Vibrio tubiashii]|uniref:Prepilin type IV endopeptidase peptidase domain-containing protein n=1 Tax=Vibrio tubiashii TaxID=29498 RepID=A0AAE5GVH3_9VIBR|nr:prepilin peptidase [Vibrio tubiashii]NOI83647.1 hypothetical protein [Vibrio tubiashii]